MQGIFVDRGLRLRWIEIDQREDPYAEQVAEVVGEWVVW